MYCITHTSSYIQYIGSKATVCTVLMAGTRTVSLQKQTRKSSFLTEESHTNHTLIIHCLLLKRGNSYLVVRVAHNRWITISLCIPLSLDTVLRTQHCFELLSCLAQDKRIKWHLLLYYYYLYCSRADGYATGMYWYGALGRLELQYQYYQQSRPTTRQMMPGFKPKH